MRLCRKLLVPLLIIGIPIVLFMYTFSLNSVTVIGSTRYTTEEITNKLTQTKSDSNALLMFLKYRYFQEVKIPFVEKIDIEMEDTHSLKLYVYEKKITGYVEYLGEYLYFDKDGIVVESSSKRLEKIPQVRGLKYHQIILHEKLEVQKEKLFDVILNLTQLIEKYDLDVSSIRFNSEYEVTIDCGDIKVLLGKKSTYDEALAELENILAEAKGMKVTIDMTDYVKGTKAIIAKPSTN